MAGIVCIVAGPEDDPRRLPGRLNSALDAGLHVEAIVRRTLFTTPRVVVGVLAHSQIPARPSWRSEGGLHVACYGDPELRGKPPARAHAVDILRLYVERGAGGLSDVGGDYVLCVIDDISGKVIIQNDRRGTVPSCYASSQAGFALAPEAKCLFECGFVTPRLDLQSVVDFATHGFPLPGRTMFNDVRSMVPASRIHVDLATLRAETETYWSLRFTPDPALDGPSASAALYHEVLHAAEAATENIESGLGLFLTGGGDSRGIVSALAEIGRLPALSLTWGSSDGIPLSDPMVARELARRYGFENRFCRILLDDLPSNGGEWAYISELSADNLGFFAAPQDLFYRHGAGECDVFLIGDELFGHGGGFSSGDDAVRYLFANSQADPNRWLRGVLGVRGLEVASGSFDRSLRAILEGCDSEEPRDLVDWLTYYIHRPCWSYSAGNFKEPILPVRRPFLRDRMVDFVCRLPRRMRDDKAAYYSMLRRFMPDTFAVPRPRAESLFDWDDQLRSNAATQKHVFDTILRGGLFDSQLEGVFDRGAVGELLSSYAVARPTADRTTRSYRFHAVNARRWLNRHGVSLRLPAMLKRALRSSGTHVVASPGCVIRRLFLIALFIDRFDRMQPHERLAGRQGWTRAQGAAR